MTNARRILILLVVLTLPLWAAAGAAGKPDGAKPCDNPPCKDEPPPDPSGEVEISVQANLPWTQEASDTVIYEISVIKPSELSVDVASSLGGSVGTIEAGESTIDQTYEVLSDYENLELGGDPVTLTNIVTAMADGEVLATASAGVQLHNETPPCDFSKEIQGLCIWTPTGPGNWTVSVDPASPRPTNVLITLRDHVPGNWCPSGINAKWRPGDDPVTTTFTIPDWKGGDPGAAVCEIGGAGGDFFGVGTPSSFFLAVSGRVTVSQ
ncbi:MAG TPA: hypothetical protein VLD62_12040 [Acidimicrobiia bacterium]|nr:hypothetical protein [Acidimicrobiia bacterium]